VPRCEQEPRTCWQGRLRTSWCRRLAAPRPVGPERGPACQCGWRAREGRPAPLTGANDERVDGLDGHAVREGGGARVGVWWAGRQHGGAARCLYEACVLDAAQSSCRGAGVRSLQPWHAGAPAAPQARAGWRSSSSACRRSVKEPCMRARSALRAAAYAAARWLVPVAGRTPARRLRSCTARAPPLASAPSFWRKAHACIPPPHRRPRRVRRISALAQPLLTPPRSNHGAPCPWTAAHLAPPAPLVRRPRRLRSARRQVQHERRGPAAARRRTSCVGAGRDPLRLLRVRQGSAARCIVVRMVAGRSACRSTHAHRTADQTDGRGAPAAPGSARPANVTSLALDPSPPSCLTVLRGQVGRAGAPGRSLERGLRACAQACSAKAAVCEDDSCLEGSAAPRRWQGLPSERELLLAAPAAFRVSPPRFVRRSKAKRSLPSCVLTTSATIRDQA
jgi:hypothetical protein